MPFDPPTNGARQPAPPPLGPPQAPLETSPVAPAAVTAGSLATRTIRLWWQNLGRFTGVLLLFFLPVMLLGVVAAIAIPTLAQRGVRLQDHMGGLFGFMALIFAVSLPLAAIMLGGVSYGVVQHLAGRRVGVGAMLRQGGRRLWPLTAALALVMLAVAGSYVLLIVPGIMVAIATAVALPAATVETIGARAAFRRSLDLTRGYRWSIFGAFLLVVICQFALNMVGNLAGLVHPVAGPLLSLVVTLPAASLPWVLPAVAYHDLRLAKEGVDTSALAAVFE